MITIVTKDLSPELSPQECRRILEELAASCDPDRDRPLDGAADNPVMRLSAAVSTEHQVLLDSALSYMEERGRLSGARMGLQRAAQLLASDSPAETRAGVVNLDQVRARHDSGPSVR
ncbi:hypothetical protein F0L68_39330 [Solihabitans fulvus]|uniref:Uncharacterized protein n=1 Tax=Solihabitans fulvus TaxID=1892852 RepID=A0A5B2WE28_9PSEU|nr:hypothetical protein [Solihabitans fulvus]KAA2249545.1 hypothetical protein F0L68_39330 [Solihabitans fulvus]